MLKACNLCGREKHPEEFHKKHTSKDGLDTRCKSCRNSTQTNNRLSDLAHYMWRTARSRAKQNGLEFDISPDDVVIPDRCPILDIPIAANRGKKWANGSPSLDRIDNSKGYVRGNVAVISMQANNIKANLNVEDVELLARSMDRMIRYIRGELFR